MEESSSVLASDSQVTTLQEEDAFDVNPLNPVVQGVAGKRPTSAESRKVEKIPTKCAPQEKPGTKEVATQTEPDKDEVDGDASKGTRNVSNYNDLYRESKRNKINNRTINTTIPHNLLTDCITTTSNNEYIWKKFKELSLSLIVKIITINATFSGTLIHPKIWKTFKDLRNLQRLSMWPMASSLMIKTSKKLIATDTDAAAAAVEITLYLDSVGRKHVLTCNNISKECYDIEDCSLLVCHNVSMEVCEYLEKRYEALCRLADIMSRDVRLFKKYLLIGHRNGGDVVIYEGNWRNTANAQSYEYLSLEESAEHCFRRTMEMTPEEWSNVKETICPGDESMSVIRFAAGSFS